MSNNVEFIGEYVFCGNKSLKSIIVNKQENESPIESNKDTEIIEIPKRLTTISKSLFVDCYSIKKIVLHDDITSIGKYSFSRCKFIETILLPNKLSFLGDSAFESCTSLKEIEIPGTINEIPFQLFGNCTSLKNITIQNGVKVIKSEAFYGCASLEGISIPESVINIEKRIFWNCSSLEKINVDTENKNYCDEDGVLFNKTKSILIRFPQNKKVDFYQIPDTVKTVDEGAFQGCKFIKQIIQGKSKNTKNSLNVPSKLSRIICNAFADCCNLRKIKLTGKQIEVSSKSFLNCKSLDRIIFIEEFLQTDNTEIMRGFLHNVSTKHILAVKNGFIYYKYFVCHTRYGHRYKNMDFFDGVLYHKNNSIVRNVEEISKKSPNAISISINFIYFWLF